MIHAESAFYDLITHIQTHLDEDLSLETLSARMRMAPTRFHKTFRAAFDVTPRQYTERLRLERAAFRLLILDDTVLQVALDHGFATHETFTRAFARRFGASPQAFRQSQRVGAGERLRRARDSMGTYELSATKVRQLAPLHLATIRHVGPYENVPEMLFAKLAAWADAREQGGPRIWFGIGHDAPGVTPEQALRFDAALMTPLPFAPEGEIVCQRFSGGAFAVTTHAGPFSTLSAAYGQILPRVLALPKYDYVGLPVVEIYQASEILVNRTLNVTDICLPVRARDE